MRLLWIVAVLVAIALGGCSAPGTGQVPALPPGTRTIEAVRVGVPPTLDGKLDDACWQRAEPVTGFLYMNSDRPAKYQSFGYVSYDDAHIYIGMKCLMPKGQRPRGKPKPHDTNVFSDDIVEIMLDPGATRSDYYQLVVNAYGATFDCSRLHGGSLEDDSWNGEWTAATHIAEDYWSVETAVPFHALGISPRTGSTWGINLCREAIKPREMSSVALRGAFNQADKFPVVKGVNVDFSPYFFRIGPGVAIMDSAADKPRATFNMPVNNLTGRPKEIKIDIYHIGQSGKEPVKSKVLTLAPDESATLSLETLDMEPLLAGRTDLYMIRSRSKTGKIVVSDAATGKVLALSLVKRPRLCEAMKIVVDDPWRRGMSREKTPAISLTVHTLLPTEHLKDGELSVTVASRDTGKVVASTSFSNPSETTSVKFGSAAIPWGAYEARAVFKDAAARKIVSSRSPATVLPGGKYHVKVLNNLVSELMNADERGLLGKKEIAFMNPRDGWCFFSVSGRAKPTLNSEQRPLATNKAAEAMRDLPAGRHVLRIEGRIDQLIVRAVPALMYYAYNTNPAVEPYGPYDWAFTNKHVLRNYNIIAGGTSREAIMREWTSQGRKWIVSTPIPGTSAPGTASGAYGGFASVDKVFRYWTSPESRRSAGFLHPLTSGTIGDEVSTGSEQQLMNWADALRRIADDPKFKGRVFYPFCQSMGSEAGKVFAEVVMEAGWNFAPYRYLIEQSTEEQARALIKDQIIGTALAWNNTEHNGIRRVLMVLGYLSQPPESQNINPSVNFKTYMDMQLHTLATHPAFFGLHGIQEYSVWYCDEENLRWASRLFRHYAIEGNTARLSKDPYVLTHIRNGDFEDGTDGWTIVQAEPGSVRADRLAGYGRRQKRYIAGSQGDTFLVMKRSATGPNAFSQEIKNLEPGRAYSMKMITADYGNIRAKKSVKKQDAISIQLGNAQPIKGPRKNFQYTFGKKGSDWMNYHWRVFRASGETARLTISDWITLDNPGGPVGQELMFNFIEIQPYLE